MTVPARPWLYSRWIRVLLGLVVGSVIGLVVYQASQLDGLALFILAGATAGGVAALVVHGYAATARLTSVTVTIPQLSEMQFVMSRDTKQVAWKLFVETVTRVSTQQMDSRSGLLREALTSLYGLFQTTRETLKTVEPSRPGRDPTVEQLAITMLNVELRPFLSRWHTELTRWEKANPDTDETRWPANQDCREALAQTQARLREYSLGYAKLAGVTDAVARIVVTGGVLDVGQK